MSATVSVIFAVAMLVLLVWAIMKKLQPVMVLWVIGTIALIIVGVVNHGGIAEASSGSAVLDAFEYFKECMGSQFAGTALLIMSVMGYVGYMNYLKAGDLFAVYVARPLQKLKAKYLVVGLIVFLDWIFVMALPSGIATIALLFGTLYPVMIYLGVNTLTAGCAIVIGVGVFATPANFFPAQVLQDLQMDISLAEAFVKYMLPIALIMEVFFVLAYVLQSRRMDKKLAAKEQKAEEVQIPDPKSFGLPWYYALLPLIPFVAIIGFSSLFFDNITISVVAANLLSFAIAFIVHMISSKKPVKETFNEGFQFFQSIGDSVGPVAMIIIAGTFFAGALEATGGMNVIIDALIHKASMPISLFIVFASVLAALMYAATGSSMLGLYSIGPLLAQAVLDSGSDLAVPALLIFTISSNILGAAISPISAANMFAAGFLKCQVTDVIKRCAMPSVVAFLVSVIATFIIF